jgi:hypothetical protein
MRGGGSCFFLGKIFILTATNTFKMTATKDIWVESRAKERKGHNFVKTVLELSGYKVMNFGIENHNQEIVRQLKKSYKFETNRRLLSMPDYVVIDDETKEAWLVEVKTRNLKQPFELRNTTLLFKYGGMKIEILKSGI